MRRTWLEAIPDAWGDDTTSVPDDYSMLNIAEGQCAVTALVVQDHLGGDLLRTTNEGVSHYWNRLPDGSEIDLTRQQFVKWEPGEIIEREREYVLSFPDTARRYAILKERVDSYTAPTDGELDRVKRRLRPKSPT